MAERLEVGTSAEERAAVDLVALPSRPHAPLSAVLRRVGFAMALVLFIAIVVTVGRDGYSDSAGGEIGFIDALYYASVTVTTTGYGDITAISTGARVATIFLITPARIMFLILVVGTTVEVLTDQSRKYLLTKRWRQRVNNHFIICGYGSTGHSAGEDLIRRGVPKDQIIAVDNDPDRIRAATTDGLVAIEGDASLRSVLAQAAIDQARGVIITTNRDDTAVLITLTARELNPDAHIVAGGLERENLHLLRQSGADEVIDATAAVGRMLGLGTYAPGSVKVLDDILDAGTGLDLAEVSPTMVDGKLANPPGTTLLAIFRSGERLTRSEMAEAILQSEDRLVVLKENAV